MPSPAVVKALLTAPLLQLVLAVAVSAQQLRPLSGRVIDESTLQPIADVVVRVRGTELSALTGSDGLFRFQAVPVGARQLVFEHVAYGEHVDTFAVRSEEETFLQIRLTARAVELPGVVVEGRTELEQRRQSTGFSMNEIQRPEIEEAAKRGQTLWELLRDAMPQVAVRDASRGIAACVEFRGAMRLTGGCNHMSIFMDGVLLSAPGTVYPNIPLGDIERLEAISPGQAGVQYGTLGGNGVLLIETRTGPRPNRPDGSEEMVTYGFDWDLEPQPYAWKRVVGGAFLVNALGLGLGIAAAHQCLQVSDQTLGVQEGCAGMKALGAGALALALPVFGTSYAVRWGGGTDRSRGRLMPSVILASASAITGYLLVIQGQDVAGGVLLGLGIPSLSVFSDRLFRVLR
jgi:hypothetical protein